MYRLRAKVQIEARDQLSVLAGLTGRPAERGITFEDPRLAALGHRTIGATAEMPSATLPAEAYRAHRLELGRSGRRRFRQRPDVRARRGLDELHAIDFAKGCYVGQELTARMKHRGTARKRLLAVEGAVELKTGVELRAKGNSIGDIVSAYGRRGFALVRLDRWKKRRALTSKQTAFA